MVGPNVVVVLTSMTAVKEVSIKLPNEFRG